MTSTVMLLIQYPFTKENVQTDHGNIFAHMGKVVHHSKKIEGNNPKKVIREPL